jgi:hypothetical protein
MGEKNPNRHRHMSFVEQIISAVSIGGFFIILGIVIVANQSIVPKVSDFFKDFTTVQIPNTTTYLPAPNTPAAHTAIFSAAFQFALAIAILQIIIIALCIGLRSRIERTAETVGSLVFWFGAAYVSYNLAEMKSALAQSQQIAFWFQFWAAIIMLIGLSLIVRGAILLIAGKRLTKSAT